MYLSEFDIANRALQHCGVPRMLSPTEDSRSNTETTMVYDNLRLWELRRNIWKFSIRRAVLRAIDADTLMLAPKEWNAGITYPIGAIVADANGILWASLIPENYNNDPVSTIAWERCYGPLTVHKYDNEETYNSGELVWAEAGNPGGYVIYRSLVDSNEDDPETATAWDTTVTYRAGQTVSHSGYQWRSLIEVNKGITPAVGPLDWDETALYSIGQTVTGSDGYIYSSVGSGNQGNNPVSDDGTNWTNTTVPKAWTRVPSTWASSIKWQPMISGMESILFAYPIAVGPSYRTAGGRNTFRLPAGFLRKAPLDPKAGSHSFLGAPSNLWYDDWTMEGDYITSIEPMIVIRFAADITDVRKFDVMFCEGLAARIGMEVCEPLTQNTGKITTIAGKYQKFMSEARIVNAIEVGSEEPAEDELISVRN